MTKGRCGLGGGEAGAAAEHGRKDPPEERPDAADVSHWTIAGHAWALQGEGRGPGTAASSMAAGSRIRATEDAAPWPLLTCFGAHRLDFHDCVGTLAMVWMSRTWLS